MRTMVTSTHHAHTKNANPGAIREFYPVRDATGQDCPSLCTQAKSALGCLKSVKLKPAPPLHFLHTESRAALEHILYGS